MELLSNQEIPDTFEMKEKRLKKSLMTKLRAMEYATHDKNLYAINNVSNVFAYIGARVNVPILAERRSQLCSAPWSVSA